MEHLLFTIICGLLCMLSEDLPTGWQGIDPVRIFIIVLLDPPLTSCPFDQERIATRSEQTENDLYSILLWRKEVKNAKKCRLSDGMRAQCFLNELAKTALRCP